MTASHQSNPTPLYEAALALHQHWIINPAGAQALADRLSAADLAGLTPDVGVHRALGDILSAHRPANVGPLSEPDARSQAHALLVMAHALRSELDTMQTLVADLCALDENEPSVVEAVWNAQSPGEGLLFLMGQLPVHPDQPE